MYPFHASCLNGRGSTSNSTSEWRRWAVWRCPSRKGWSGRKQSSNTCLGWLLWRIQKGCQYVARHYFLRSTTLIHTPWWSRTKVLWRLLCSPYATPLRRCHLYQWGQSSHALTTHVQVGVNQHFLNWARSSIKPEKWSSETLYDPYRSIYEACWSVKKRMQVQDLKKAGGNDSESRPGWKLSLWDIVLLGLQPTASKNEIRNYELFFCIGSYIGESLHLSRKGIGVLKTDKDCNLIYLIICEGMVFLERLLGSRFRNLPRLLPFHGLQHSIGWTHWHILGTCFSGSNLGSIRFSRNMVATQTLTRIMKSWKHIS